MYPSGFVEKSVYPAAAGRHESHEKTAHTWLKHQKNLKLYIQKNKRAAFCPVVSTPLSFILSNVSLPWQRNYGVQQGGPEGVQGTCQPIEHIESISHHTQVAGLWCFVPVIFSNRCIVYPHSSSSSRGGGGGSSSSSSSRGFIVSFHADNTEHVWTAIQARRHFHPKAAWRGAHTLVHKFLCLFCSIKLRIFLPAFMTKLCQFMQTYVRGANNHWPFSSFVHPVQVECK